MPPKTSSANRRAVSSRKKSDPIEIVVRRGAIRRFDALKTKTKTGELPVVVTWDRRADDRRAEEAPRTARERRAVERRQKPPFTWDLADFVVVERQARPRGPTRPGRKKPAGKS